MTNPSTIRGPRVAADLDAGPERRERVEALRAGVLRLLVLDVACGHVVQAGDAEDVVPRLRRRHAVRPPADDDREFRLVVRLVRRRAESRMAPPGSSTALGGLMNSSGSGGMRLLHLRRVVLDSSGRRRRSSRAHRRVNGDGAKAAVDCRPVGEPVEDAATVRHGRASGAAVLFDGEEGLPAT